jgi:hypothetical protein
VKRMPELMSHMSVCDLVSAPKLLDYFNILHGGLPQIVGHSQLTIWINKRKTMAVKGKDLIRSKTVYNITEGDTCHTKEEKVLRTN